MSDFHRLKKHPNTMWVMGRRDLPGNKASAKFEVMKPDATTTVKTFGKRKRQIIELLMKTDVFCASPVRISDVVSILKRDDDIDIHTHRPLDQKEDSEGSYGIYQLRDKIRFLGEVS